MANKRQHAKDRSGSDKAKIVYFGPNQVLMSWLKNILV